MVKFGPCFFCKLQAKYKCPSCNSEYCSLVCYKSPEHVKLDESSPVEKSKPKSHSPPPDKNDPNAKFHRIMQDSQIQSMLKYKGLQHHLQVILQILNDVAITKEYQLDDRRDIANMKLCNLRKGGSEENEVIEDFIARFLQLYESM